ncbi:hypothetical protein C0Q70_21307 [Pomacea canaliculata]|uniref:Fucosyltransferase n=1 Tax=Pomacea canaliculata TaxID=400727 RepID=A0A2T7NC74_POMCA|nr:hypothetical protein C0Q70_21307 [Pomacea canaliculata]
MPGWMNRKSYAEVFGHCPVSACNLSTNYDVDRAAGDAVVFYGDLSDIPVPPRAFPDQVYVYYLLESPTRLWFSELKSSWNSGESSAVHQNSETQDVFGSSGTPDCVVHSDSKHPDIYFNAHDNRATTQPQFFNISLLTTESRASVVNNKLIVWYNMHESMQRKSEGELFGHCPVSTCNLSTNYSADSAAGDAVVFDGAPLEIPVPPRAFPDQVYVFYMLEPPPKLWFGEQKTSPWNSAGCRYNNDILYLEHSKQLPNISFLKDLVRKKEKPAAWFVSNCHQDQAQRLRYVERLKEVIPVDVYGDCGTLHCTTLAKECDTMLTKYFFYLSFENSFCQDYVTEKFSRAFLKDVYVVPVVRGGLNYSHHFPEGIFINADDFSSPEELGLYLKKLMNDEDAYIEMLWRIAHFVNLDSDKNPHYYSWCQLCDKLHRLQDNAKTYPDLFGWYYDGTCRPPREF